MAGASSSGMSYSPVCMLCHCLTLWVLVLRQAQPHHDHPSQKRTFKLTRHSNVNPYLHRCPAAGPQTSLMPAMSAASAVFRRRSRQDGLNYLHPHRRRSRFSRRPPATTRPPLCPRSAPASQSPRGASTREYVSRRSISITPTCVNAAADLGAGPRR